MIIGNGLIGFNLSKKIINHNNFVYFCSGVSNSNETDDKSFEREKKLLIKIINENIDSKIVYFSSVLNTFSNNKYYQHKSEMEKIISQNTKNYQIFRLPQVIGNNGNKNNLFNFLVESISKENTIPIFENVKRALLDIDDLIKIVEYCKEKNEKIINISFFEKLDILDLVVLISEIMNKSPKVKIVKNVEFLNWDIDNSDIVNEFININKIEKVGYTKKVIKKYINV